MPNDTGLTGWTLMLPVGSNEHIPCFQHSEENKAIIVSWDDVPELQLSKWSTQGYVEAIFQYGNVLLEKGEYDNAWKLFLKGAKKNDKFCIFYLGVMLGEGLGMQINKELALKQYHLAADLGHMDSQYNIAQAYLQGNGIDQNIQKALYYFNLAASQGDPESNYNLGIIYFIGDLIPKDLDKALKYFETALANGFSNAVEYINKIKSSESLVNKITELKKPTKFVCLANSFKEGGRCLAGIELDANNNPLIVNGHPKWIRPICNTPHGEVHTHLVSHINILDIIEVEITNYPDVNNYQSENVYFRENSLRVVGNYDNDKLDRLCDNHNLIFGNKGKAVSEEAIANNTFSLMVIKVNTFEVIEKTYEDNPNKSQIRLVFSFNGNQYDLPVTDPVFLHRYQTNPDFLENYNQLYVSLSLAVEWKGWYYKLIAGIILSHYDNVNVFDEDDLPF